MVRSDFFERTKDTSFGKAMANAQLYESLATRDMLSQFYNVGKTFSKLLLPLIFVGYSFGSGINYITKNTNFGKKAEKTIEQITKISGLAEFSEQVSPFIESRW